MRIKQLFFVLLPVVYGNFYSKTSDVIELDEHKFKNEMLKSDQVWVVEFYAPWCGHCKNLKPEYEKAATALKGVVNVAAVDMTQYQSLGAPYQVQGFPTIKIFGKDKAKPKDYNGERAALGIVNSALSTLKDVVRHRLNPTKKSSSSKPKSSSSSKGSSPVLEFTDDSFDDEVFTGQSDMIMVAFVAPWCGHCKALLPEWKDAANELVDTGIQLATVDATANSELAQRFQVQGYPTIKVFPPNRSGDDDAMDYNGPREASGITQYALNEFDRLGGSVSFDVPQVYSQDTFNELCLGRKKSCILAFLPDIRDSFKTGREKEVELLTEIRQSNRHIPIGWVEAGALQNWEDTYNMHFGFPAILYLRQLKEGDNIGILFKGKFTKESISSFINGRKSMADAVHEWPSVGTSEKWDGEDAPVIEEDDDFDLDAFLNDED